MPKRKLDELDLETTNFSPKCSFHNGIDTSDCDATHHDVISNDVTASNDVTESNDVTTSDSVTTSDDVTASGEIASVDAGASSDVTTSNDVTTSDSVAEEVKEEKTEKGQGFHISKFQFFTF